jgi:hypothetical protein
MMGVVAIFSAQDDGPGKPGMTKFTVGTFAAFQPHEPAVSSSATN